MVHRIHQGNAQPWLWFRRFMQGRAKAATIVGVSTQVAIMAWWRYSPAWDLLTENQDRLLYLTKICAATGASERTLQACCHEPCLRFGIAACSRSSFDGGDERLGRTRLSKIGDAPGCDRVFPRCFAVECRHEDHRKLRVRGLQLTLQFNARHPAQMNVQNQARRRSRARAGQELLGRGERLHVEPAGGQETLH